MFFDPFETLVEDAVKLVTGNEDYKFGEGSDTLDIFFEERYGNATKIQSFADIVEGMPRGSTSRLR
jgi:hypothetical protein